MSEPHIAQIQRLAEILIARGWMLAVAESCTGGLVGDLITDTPGSSAYFVGGIIAYANALKTDLLRVPSALIMEHGAVSAPVAASMARGICDVTRADVGVAITGIAGPSGGTLDKPVGTVFIAIASPLGELVRRCQWPGDRTQNKVDSAYKALELLAEHLI